MIICLIVCEKIIDFDSTVPWVVVVLHCFQILWFNLQFRFDKKIIETIIETDASNEQANWLLNN